MRYRGLRPSCNLLLIFLVYLTVYKLAQMITRVEISGFKSFTGFAVDLAPLSVIAGANASGKSNFLDALQIIKGLATGKTLEEANGRRGILGKMRIAYVMS